MCDHYLTAAEACQAVADQMTGFPESLVYGVWEAPTPAGTGRCAEGWVRHFTGNLTRAKVGVLDERSHVGTVYTLAVQAIMEQIRGLGYAPYCTCPECGTKGRSISIPEWNDKMKPSPSLVAQVCSDAANSLRRQARGEMEKRAFIIKGGTSKCSTKSPWYTTTVWDVTPSYYVSPPGASYTTYKKGTPKKAMLTV